VFDWKVGQTKKIEQMICLTNLSLQHARLMVAVGVECFRQMPHVFESWLVG